LEQDDVPGLRRLRRGHARRRHLLPDLRRGDDKPGLPDAAMSGHAHSHAHGHAHVHTVSETTDARRLTTGLALIVGLMVAEVVAGITAHSLALVSDAAHMLTDAGALLLSLVVIRLVRRPAEGNLT